MSGALPPFVPHGEGPVGKNKRESGRGKKGKNEGGITLNKEERDNVGSGKERV